MAGSNQVQITPDVGLMASGTTEAAGHSAITPDADGFVCAIKRATAASASAGMTILIVDPSDPESNGTPGEGDTASTLRATLAVFGVRDSVAFPISNELVLCDHSTDPVTLRAANDVVEFTAEQINNLQIGDTVEIVYSETGDLGEIPDGQSIQDAGSRPTFLILDWPLVTPASF